MNNQVLKWIIIALTVLIIVALILHFVAPKKTTTTNIGSGNTGGSGNNTPPPPQSNYVGKLVYKSPNIDTANIHSGPSNIIGFFGLGSNIICANPDGQKLLDVVNADGSSVWSEEYWNGANEAWYKIQIDNTAACGGATVGYVKADEVILK